MTEPEKTEKTVDDLLTADKKQEQTEFDEAFDEIVDGDEDLKKDLSDDANGHLNKDEDKGTALAEQHKKDEEAKKKADEEAEAAKAKQEEGLLKGPETKPEGDDTDGAGTATDETKSDNPFKDELDKAKADLAAERQKTASWQGRITAANKKAEEAEARAKEAAEAKTDTEVEEEKNASEEEDKVLSQFYDDFPELKVPLEILFKKSGSKSKTEILDEIKPTLQKVDDIEETQTATADSTHLDGIREAHGDIEDIVKSGKMLAWIESQPGYLKPGLLDVYHKGSTQDSIDLISEFKRVTGYGKQTDKETQDKTDKDKKAKLESMLQVDSDSSGPPANEPDKSDFDAAAKEIGL